MAISFASQAVGDIVRQQLSRARVMEQFHIDYCCHGRKLLHEACSEAGHDLRKVCQDLEQADANRKDEVAIDWAQQPLEDLIENILQNHHAYLRKEFPRLLNLTDRVVAEHGEDHRELFELREILKALVGELSSHMIKEEQVLFPIVIQLEKSIVRGEPLPPFHCGSVNNPIAVMEDEHESAGHALSRLRFVTAGYEPPDDACESYRALMQGLEELETDLHLHIHKENNILFPRAAAMEMSLLP